MILNHLYSFIANLRFHPWQCVFLTKVGWYCLFQKTAYTCGSCSDLDGMVMPAMVRLHVRLNWEGSKLREE